jgi:hypothetical protein
MDHVLPPEQDAGVRAADDPLVDPGLGDAWLRAVCWDNPVAMFGSP